MMMMMVGLMMLGAAVGWENSVNSLRAALAHYNTEPAQAFLNKCFHQIITILLDQQ